MIRTLLSKILAMFRTRQREADFEAEVQSHLDMLVEENQGRGMAPEEARSAALRHLGNMTQLRENQREGRGLAQLETLFADLRYGARMLRANPGFTLIAVLTLTLGIGVVTTVFTAYNAVALKPLPVADPNRVVRLERWFEHPYHGDIQYQFSYPEYRYVRDHNDSFSNLVTASGLLAVAADSVERLRGELVSANYFSDLEVPAHLGRTFLPAEDSTPGGNPVLVLSYSFWQRRFHGDPEILGRVLRLNNTAFTIVGVTAKEFSGTSVFPQIPDFWAPVSMQEQIAPGRDWLNTPGDCEFQILARLKQGMTLKRAESEISVLIRQFAGTYKERERTATVTLQHTSLLGNTEDPRFQASALAMMLIVGMVLLVGCVNIANMLLARGAARQREISVRLALGASRGRVIRQLLTESFLLSILGGLGGLLVSVWTSRMLWVVIEQFIRERLDANIAVGIDLNPDGRVLAYAMFLSLVAGLLFGLSPALQFSRPDLTSALKQEGGFGGQWSRSRLRSLLVATQVTVSMVLLISAGLLMRGLSRAQIAEPGFETRDVYLVDGQYGDSGNDPVKAAALQRRLMDRLLTLPEVRNVAIGTMPLLGTWTPPIIVGNSRGAGNLRGRTLASYASETYFDTLGIPLLRGRSFHRLEAEQGANVALISEATARTFWPGQDPIGKHLKLDMNWRGSFTEFEVIGIVKDVRFASLSRIDTAHVYLTPKRGGLTGLLVRTEGDPRRALSSIRAEAGSVDPAFLSAVTMNLEAGPARFQRSFAQVSALLAAILAGLALVLAGVGIYGVMAYLVTQRVKEIGIRVALGARASHVLLAVVVRGLRPVFYGLVLGIAGAAGLSAFLHSILVLPGSPDVLFGVPFYDPVTFVGLSLFLTAIAAVASAVPARRALKVDPMIALRYE